MSYLRDISSIKNVILMAQKENLKVNLLMGAGCSKTAGIPLASGMMEEIKSKHFHEKEVLESSEYGHCMSLLTPNERRTIIYKFVEGAKINWAHIGIAQLMKNGYINRIFTTNFDNLVARACSLVGEYPGIYDLAFTDGDKFRTDLLYDKSILHLHGQHTGFVLCNTNEEVTKQANSIRSIFKELNRNSIWLVVGYSGSNDAIFELLSECETFENRLYWIGYNNNEPELHVKENILKKGKYGFFVQGYDADSFFVELSKELSVFPPNFIDKPFTYLEERLDELIEYKMPRQFGSLKRGDVKESTKSVLHRAIESIENNNEIMLEHYIRVGKFDKFNDTLNKLIGEEAESRNDIYTLYEKMEGVLSESVEDLKDDYNKLKYIIENGEGSLQSYFSIHEVLSYLALTIYDDVLEISDETFEAKLLYLESFEWLLKAYETNKDNVDLIVKLFNTSLLITENSDISWEVELFFSYALEFMYEHYTISECNDSFISNVNLALSKLRHVNEEVSEDCNLVSEFIKSAETIIRKCDDFGENIDDLHSWLRLIKRAIKYNIELDDEKSIRKQLKITADKVNSKSFSIENTKSIVSINKSLIDVYESIGENTEQLIIITLNLLEKAHSTKDEQVEVCFNWLLFLSDNFEKLSTDKILQCHSIHELSLEFISEHRQIDKRAINRWYEKVIVSDYLDQETKVSYMDEIISSMKELFESNSFSDPAKIIMRLNEISYFKIEEGHYIFIDKILELVIGYSKDEYPIATLGYWYLNNTELDIAEAESQGKFLYEAAVKLATFTDKELGKAFHQKYLLELARFYQRTNDSNGAKNIIAEAVGIGEIDEHEEIYFDAYEFYQSMETNILN